MSFVLNSTEIQILARIMRLLVSPGACPNVDTWRHTINESVKALLRADSAGFLLPGVGRAAMFSRDHDPDELNRYPDTPVPTLKDGTPIFQVMTRMGVGRLSDAYGRDYRDRYLNSPYYNEYAGPNGAHQCTFLAAPMLDGYSQRSVASVQLWRASRHSRPFSERDVAVLQLLLPAFEAGIKIYSDLAGDAPGVRRLLDSLAGAVAIFEADGREVHRSEQLATLLTEDLSGAATVRAAVRDTATVLIDLRSGDGTAEALGRRVVRDVRTARDLYRVSGVIAEGSRDDDHARVVVRVEHLSATPHADAMRGRYGLTPAETRVALLLREGKSNAEIASALGISPHTTRRHTEAVLSKLGVRSRAEVAARLQG